MRWERWKQRLKQRLTDLIGADADADADADDDDDDDYHDKEEEHRHHVRYKRSTVTQQTFRFVVGANVQTASAMPHRPHATRLSSMQSVELRHGP